MKRAVLLLCALLTLGGAAAGQTRDINGDGFVDILVPVVVREEAALPGAYGSLWSTEVWLHNGTAVSFTHIQRSLFCPLGVTCARNFPAGQTVRVTNTLDGPANAGALYFVEPQFAENVTLSARLFELSRRAQPNGIEIPVVWEPEFRRSELRLIGLPRAIEVRTALRIYDVRRVGLTFDVQILDGSGVMLARTVISATEPLSVHDVHLPFVAVIPDVANLIPPSVPSTRYDVRITPVVAGEFWAFASVTDRDTQHVLIVSPDK